MTDVLDRYATDRVREARPLDYTTCLLLHIAMHEEEIGRQLSADETQVFAARFGQHFFSPGWVIQILEDPEAGIIGQVMLMQEPADLHEDGFVVSVFGLYVKPEHRGAESVLPLLKRARDLGRDSGALRLAWTVTGEMKPFYEQIGAEATDTVYRLEVA